MRVHFPYAPAPRTAVLAAGLTPAQMIRKMRRCRAVAGPYGALGALARALDAAEVALCRPIDAVLVFTGPTHGELTELERDLFWRVFQAPVFEQLFDAEGRPAARECQAHEGLHVLDAEGSPPGALNYTLCGCGDASPRLIASRAEQLQAA